MKRNNTTTFARKVDNADIQPYSKREVKTYIKSITRELRSCPEHQVTKLINIITDMKAL